MNERPTVTIAVPVLNEERHIEACLDAIAAQRDADIIEVLVVDGGSTDETRVLAAGRPRVRVVDNPKRIQAAALNIALDEAKGEVFVRVDGHCTIDPDYVANVVDALTATGAAMVGGAMIPVAQGWLQQGIAAAMSSPFGAGPARFHIGGDAGWTDTVYLGAFRTDLARELGGYAEVAFNEDAELAFRMSRRGGVWFDPSIRSTYAPRSSVLAVARQFFRYGRGRARTVKAHPSSLSPRQLAAPALVVGLLLPTRRRILPLYLAGIAAAALWQTRRDPKLAAPTGLAMTAMHAPWGVGFLVGLVRRGR